MVSDPEQVQTVTNKVTVEIVRVQHCKGPRVSAP